MNRPASPLATHAWSSSVDSLAGLLFPPVCPLCDHLMPAAGTLCGVCQNQFRAAAVGLDRQCQRCASPLPRVVLGDRPPKCPGCSAMPHRPAFDAAEALYRYDGAVKRAIVAAKYPANGAVIRVLAERLTQHLRVPAESGARPVLLAVPSRWTRRASRGGSGIGSVVARVRQRLRLPEPPKLRATRSMAKQAWIDDPQRWTNAAGAFAVRTPPWSNNSQPLAGQHLTLIDDVMTTGATADAAAAALKAAGADRVDVLVIARAVRGPRD